jgi:diaminopimelate decarboxylase
MHHFEYRAGEMFAEGVPLKRIAREVGTPAYIYSLATLRRHYQVFDRAFAQVRHIVVFPSANSPTCRSFANERGGFDIVPAANCFAR